MKNRIKEILDARLGSSLRPSERTLQQLNVHTLHRFNKILNNKVDMTQAEIAAFKQWLHLDSFEELFEYEEVTA
jgi:hypothetical protein